MKNSYHIALIFILSLMLSACGFHLRGHEPLPTELQNLYVTSNNPYSNLTKELIQTLQSTGIHIASGTQSAPITLQLLNENIALNMTSYGNVGQTTNYLLNYTLTYQLLDRDGITLLTPQTITVIRNYSITSSQINSDLYVRNELENEMRREIIYQLLNRLRSPVVRNSISQKMGLHTQQIKN